MRVGGFPHLEPPEVVTASQPRLCGVTNHNGVFQSSVHPHRTHKHAFVRAQRRATQQGGAIYRGRWFSAEQLGVTQVTRQDHPTPKTPKPSAARLSFLSWNASSLSAARNAELQTWLNSEQGCSVDILAVQETHWRGPLEYRTGRFLAIHSGATKAEAGILALTNTQKFPGHTIHRTEVVPGRLVHIRLEAEPCIDIVLVYQHAWSSSRLAARHASQQDVVLARRAELWAKLSTLISNLPKRNQLLLLGDYNTRLTTEGSIVGRGVCKTASTHCRICCVIINL